MSSFYYAPSGTQVSGRPDSNVVFFVSFDGTSIKQHNDLLRCICTSRIHNQWQPSVCLYGERQGSHKGIFQAKVKIGQSIAGTYECWKSSPHTILLCFLIASAALLPLWKAQSVTCLVRASEMPHFKWLFKPVTYSESWGTINASAEVFATLLCSYPYI